MIDRAARRHASRRAALYRHHAHDLADKAAQERDASQRRHMLDLVATYRRAADQLAPLPPTEQDTAFTATPSRV